MTQPARSRRMPAPRRPAPTSAACPLAECLAAAIRPVRRAAGATAHPAFAGAVLDAEDALFAALGAVATGQLEAVRGTLVLLAGAQRADGCIPAALAPAAGLVSRLAARFGRADDALAVARYDGVAATALFLWAGAAYARATGDRQFLQDHEATFTRALAWLEARRADGLPSSDGRTPDLWAGALTYRALRAMGELAVPRGEAIAAARYWARAAQLREQLNARFWEPGRGRYAGDGRANLLAAAVGVAARGQALAILAAADDGYGLETGMGFYALAAAGAADPARLRRALEAITDDPAEAGRLLWARADRPTPAMAQ